MKKALIRSGTVVGFTASTAAAAFLIFYLLKFIISRPPDVTDRTCLVFGLLLLLAGLAAFASLKRFPLGLALAFLVGFFPFGLYLAGVPGSARWIGVCFLMFLPAAGLIAAGKR